MDLEIFKEKLFENHNYNKSFWKYFKKDKVNEGKDEDLISYIQLHFQEVRYKDISKLRENLKVLKKLDNELMMIAIGKMNMLIENYKGLSQVTFIFTIVISAFVLYADILTPLVILFVFENIDVKNQYAVTALTSLVKIVLTIIVALLLSIPLSKSKSDMITAVYFKTLLEDVRRKK